MSRRISHQKRVLAVYPKSRRFGYVVLEWPLTLVEWGVKSTRTNKEAATQAKVDAIARQYRPECVIVEDATHSRRCDRIRKLIDKIRHLAESRRIASRAIPTARVRKAFQAFGAKTKYETAHTIAEHLPDLAAHLPKRRKPWTSEDPRMAVFDAAALALAYFYSRRARRRSS